MLSIEGIFLSDKKEITRCGLDHFSNVLNMNSIINEELIINLLQKPVIEEPSVAL